MPFLPIAIRAYTQRTKRTKAKRRAPWPRNISWPRHVVIFDTETKTDKTQRLTFGSYRFCRWSKDGTRLERLEEGLFYDDELPKIDPEGFAYLQEYVRTRPAETIEGCPDEIRLYSRAEFAEEVLYKLTYRARALLVGFNLPFDLSRVAIGCGAARGRWRGGFSFFFSRYRRNGRGRWRPNPYRPRIRIRHLDSKKAFIEFVRPTEVDEDDQRPVDGAPPDPNYSFPGHFLDLRTLAFALTSQGYTLASACEAFGVAHPKTKAERHGVITSEYIDYNRRDVLASAELLEKLRAEFDRHPIELDPCKAYSAASLAKAYFRAMGLTPPSEQFKTLPPELLGQAMTAFYGGRAEARVRKTVVPVVYTDFLSMYPTIQTLMDLWDILTAETLEVVEATEEFQSLLDRATIEDVFRPEFWRELRGFAQVNAQGDILPIRARHNDIEWTVGVNALTSSEPLWYGIPDLVASKLLTGRAPRLRQAFRLVPKGTQKTLRPVLLGGAVSVDPSRENLFKTVIEERQRIKKDRSLSRVVRDRLQLFLKILANAGSYGVFVEMNRNQLQSGKSEKLWVYGREGRFDCETSAPEKPGAYCFPPVASLITAGARLMLASLESVVAEQGGTYAFADTDSMAIVANEPGGLVACEGGPHWLPDGRRAIRALSWETVDAIVKRFAALNPYDPKAVPGSILKVEGVNFDPETEKQRPIHAFAISAKRYALFTLDSQGHPEIVKGGYSEHGLGQLLNPLDPGSEETNWIGSVWQGLLEEQYGGPRFDPDWTNQPPVMRASVSTPLLLDRFRRINRGKPYAEQVKPFNFLLSVTVSSIEWPPEAFQSGAFHLIAPYSSNPAEWSQLSWTDLHSGREYRIKTEGNSNRAAIHVQTFGDILDRFRVHPESKSSDAEGRPADSRTIGLLGRLHVSPLSVCYIGKETNLIEDQEKRVVPTDPQAIYPTGREWERIRPHLARVPLAELSARSGVSERMLRALRRGARESSRGSRREIEVAIGRMLDDSNE